MEGASPTIPALTQTALASNLRGSCCPDRRESRGTAGREESEQLPIFKADPRRVHRLDRNAPGELELGFYRMRILLKRSSGRYRPCTVQRYGSNQEEGHRSGE